MGRVPNELMRMLASAMSDDDEDEASEPPPQRQGPDALKEAFSAMSHEYRFHPGDFVRWKTLDEGGSLKNRKRPYLGDTAIVIEHLVSPAVASEENDAGSPYFREPLDLLLGIIDKAGNLDVYHYDARRFEPATEKDDLLTELATGLSEKHQFRPGMLVTWKPGLRNKKAPLDDVPVVIQEVLDTPVLSSKSGSGTPYFREPYDLVCGMLDADNEYVLYHLDSRRFMPWKQKVAAKETTSERASTSAPRRGKRKVIA